MAAEMRDAGDYRCVVENVAGQIDRNFNLTVMRKCARMRASVTQSIGEVTTRMTSWLMSDDHM